MFIEVFIWTSLDTVELTEMESLSQITVIYRSVLYFHPCFVIFRYLWWHVSCWRYRLLNMRKERDSDLFRTRNLDIVMTLDTLEPVVLGWLDNVRCTTHRWNTHTECGEGITNCRLLVPLTDSSLPCSIFHTVWKVIFFENFFFKEFTTTPVKHRCLLHSHFRTDSERDWMFVRWVGW